MNPAPIVMLHGWGLTPAVWSDFASTLSESRQVLTPALPGHGGRAGLAQTDLRAWGDALIAEIPEHAILCGWSLGGQIALDLALRYPERVSRLVLIGATPRFVSLAQDAHNTHWPHGLDASTVRSFIEGFELDPATIQRRFIALQTLGDRERRKVGAHLAGALSNAAPSLQAGLAAGLAVLEQTDLRAPMTSIRQTSLILHGTNDSLMPAGAATWMADHLGNARLHLIEDCGHAPFLSRHAECASLIEDFICD